VNSSVSYRKCRVSFVTGAVEVELDATACSWEVTAEATGRGIGWRDTLRAARGRPSYPDPAVGECDD
jgi:hypothetical protein